MIDIPSKRRMGGAERSPCACGQDGMMGFRGAGDADTLVRR